MKRHPALQDLSRDHFVLLNAVQAVERGAVPAWPDWLGDHFDEEEVLLADYLPPDLAQRWRADHARLRGLAGEALAAALRTHIRWEEHAIFAWLQENLSEAQLETIGRASLAHRRAVRPDGIGPNRRG